LTDKRVLLLNDYRPLFSELANRLRTVGAQVVVAKDVTTASWYTDSERLDTVLAFFDRERPRERVGELIRQVRDSRTNARIPVQVVADDLDAESVKRLVSLGVANIIMAPKNAEDLLHRLEKTLTPRPGGQSYDVRLINCFLGGAREVLTFYLGAAPSVGKPRVKHGTEAAGFVTGLIAFTAASQLGSLAATFDREFIDLLAARMLGDAAGLDDAGYADLAGEMCNQILGKATVNFERLGIGLRMGLPEVLVGLGHAVVHKLDSPVILIPIESGRTTCVIEFTMNADVTADPTAR
jgi:CheY-specific phosphatase CheX